MLLLVFSAVTATVTPRHGNTNESEDIQLWMIIVVVVAVFLIVLIVVIIIIAVYRRRSQYNVSYMQCVVLKFIYNDVGLLNITWALSYWGPYYSPHFSDY